MSTKLKLALLTLVVSQLMLASPQPYTSLGSSPVNTATAPASVTFSTTLSSPSTYSLQYGSEFTVDSSSCNTDDGTGFTSCNVTFTPHAPGLRIDALLARDSSGNIIGTEYVYAIGQGPLPVFSPGTISTLYTPTGTGADSTLGIAKDTAGNIFFSDYSNHTVSKIDIAGTVTVVAGTPGTAGYSGDGGPATSATLNFPEGIAIDGAGNLYIADYDNSRIRRVDRAGIISTIAGTGTSSPSGDGGLATAASLNTPKAIVLDPSGNLFIAEHWAAVVRKIDVNGYISTYAGVNGQESATGDGGPATGAHIGRPTALATDAAGNLYISDIVNDVVRKVDSSGTISTIAGSAQNFGFSGDGGLATSAQLSSPNGLTVDPAGNIYISDSSNGRIRRIDTQGKITTIAGNGTTSSPSGDGGSAALAGFGFLEGLVLGDDGAIYVADGNIRKITSTAASLTFPDTFIGASSTPLPLQVFNIGNQDEAMGALAVSGDFSATPASTCSSSTPLTNAASCTLAVVFTPTQLGARTGSVTVTSTLQSPLSGNGVLPLSVSLGNSPVNQPTTPATVAFRSVSGTPATYQMAYGIDFSVDTGTCSSASCSVTFTPHAPGLRIDALLAKDSDGNTIGTEYVYAIGQGPLPVFSPGTISTPYTPTGQGANGTWAIAKDPAGNIFFSNLNDWTVNKIDTAGTVTVVAGTPGIPEYSGDGGPATSATLGNPKGIAIDGAGNLYIADYGNHRVRMVNSAGIISTIAGNGIEGYNGDGGPATAASLEARAVALDLSGNLYLADYDGGVIRKVDSNGYISTYAGVYGQNSATGDGGPATAAQIGSPAALGTDAAGNLYILDDTNLVVRKVDSSGTITTIAGVAGSSGFSGDGGLATSAHLSRPYGLTVDPAGNIYISDSDNGRIRKIDTQGKITSIAGNGTTNTPSGDGGFADVAGFYYPAGIVLGNDGSLYVADGNIRKIGPTATLAFPDTHIGVISAPQTLGIANIGNQDQSMSALAVSGDFLPTNASTCSAGTPLVAAATCTTAVSFAPTRLGTSTGIAIVTPVLHATLLGKGLFGPTAPRFPTEVVNGTGMPTVVTVSNVSGTPGSYTLAYGTDFTMDGTTCSASSCSITFTPHSPGLHRDALLIHDSAGQVIGTEYIYGTGKGPLPVFSPGTISTVAKPADNSAFSVVQDPAGNVYFSDVSANKIWKTDTSGTVTVLAGTGTAGYSGDGGPATGANLNAPYQLAPDGAGNLFFVDSQNHAVRMITKDGAITTVAGTPTESGYSGDGGLATAALLKHPGGIAFDLAGNLYIADTNNNVVRKVTPSGVISTFAGVAGNNGYSGDGGWAGHAAIGSPTTLGFDGAGNLYIPDSTHSVIRKVDPAEGIISTFAGTGTGGYSGNGGLATNAALSFTYGIAFDPAGNVYFTDSLNGYVRKIDTTGIINSVAGTGTNPGGFANPVYTGDGGPADQAMFGMPLGLYLGNDGSLYVADGTIRKISPTASLNFPATNVGSVSSVQPAHVLNIGNQDQDMSALAVGTNFGLDATSTCSPSTPLTTASGGCLAAVFFQPTQVGTLTSLLTVTPSLTARLTGNGIGVGSGTVGATGIDFGNVIVGSPSAPQTVTISDTGTGGLTVSSAVISGANAADFTLVNNCTSPLAAGAQCSLSVVFKPLTATAETATLTITYANAPALIPVTATVALSGTGVADTPPVSQPLPVPQPTPTPAPTSGVSGPLYFVPIAPCRIADSRQDGGYIPTNYTRDFAIGGNTHCGIPSDAAAFAVNITAVSEQSTSAYIRAWGTGNPMPFSSISNVDDSTAIGHQSIVEAGTNGSITLFTTADVHLVLDVTGYFVPDNTKATFHPLASCRAIDTRSTRMANPTLGSPSLAGGSTRSFNLGNICGLPVGAVSYLVNVTAVPHEKLDFLQIWPHSAPRPATSILNSYSGTTIANSAILQPSADGQISVFATDDTDLVIDVEGYFGANAGGLALHMVPPCRVFDTRATSAFAGNAAIPILNSSCNGNIAVNAQAYLLNAAVVPQAGHLGYLSLWSNGTAQPATSTLNSSNGDIISNMSVIPISNGVVDAYASDKTHVVLDFYGFFAPPLE